MLVVKGTLRQAGAFFYKKQACPFKGGGWDKALPVPQLDKHSSSIVVLIIISTHDWDRVWGKPVSWGQGRNILG